MITTTASEAITKWFDESGDGNVEVAEYDQTMRQYDFALTAVLRQVVDQAIADLPPTSAIASSPQPQTPPKPLPNRPASASAIMATVAAVPTTSSTISNNGNCDEQCAFDSKAYFANKPWFVGVSTDAEVDRQLADKPIVATSFILYQRQRNMLFLIAVKQNAANPRLLVQAIFVDGTVKWRLGEPSGFISKM